MTTKLRATMTVLRFIGDLKARGYSAQSIKAELWLKYRIPENRLADWLRLYRKVQELK